MSKQKVGKRRLDKYYYLAKEKGYRARSAFKLIQLDNKYDFLRCSSLIDLCAAPGGWCQVARERGIPTVIGVDLFPIKHIPSVHTIVADITVDTCFTEIRNILGNAKVDVVLHDGAPNVGTSWTQDAFVQNELVLGAARLASKFLRPGGSFLTKIFRSKDYFSVLFVLQKLFERVDVTKPLSSRNESAEIYAFCANFKDAEFDDQLFESDRIFHENDDEKVYYFREISFEDFINSSDPRAVLESYSRISFDEKCSDVPEKYKLVCEDLKLLSDVDKKNLLRLRAKLLKERYHENSIGDEISDLGKIGDDESNLMNDDLINEEEVMKEKVEKIQILMKKKEKRERKIEEKRKLKIARSKINEDDDQIDEIIQPKKKSKTLNETIVEIPKSDTNNPDGDKEISSDEESYELNNDEIKSIIQLKTDKEEFAEKSIDRRAHDEKLPDFYEDEEIEFNARGYDEEGRKKVRKKHLITTRRMRRAEKFMKEMEGNPDCDQARLLKKSIKRTRKKPKLVVSFKGRVAKRPKGPCKLVDRRMKKDLRREKKQKK